MCILQGKRKIPCVPDSSSVYADDATGLEYLKQIRFNTFCEVFDCKSADEDYIIEIEIQKVNNVDFERFRNRNLFYLVTLLSSEQVLLS